MKRVLVACEYSATVRDAFRARGFDAWSCDILPTEGELAWHIQDSLQHVLAGSRWPMWDLIIAHPPCTHLAVSGARHFAAKKADGRQDEALDFVRMILAANCDHIAMENPISIVSSHIRKPDQIIQPWQFGHGETKATCLWLKNLPKLVPTDIVEGREARVHRMTPSPDRWKERSRTLPGIANAMAEQWGEYITQSPSKPGRVAPPVTAQTQGWGNFFKFAAHDDTPSLNAWAGDVSAMVGDSLHSPIITRTKV